jgi:hypothetical protein
MGGIALDLSHHKINHNLYGAGVLDFSVVMGEMGSVSTYIIFGKRWMHCFYPPCDGTESMHYQNSMSVTWGTAFLYSYIRKML